MGESLPFAMFAGNRLGSDGTGQTKKFRISRFFGAFLKGCALHIFPAPNGAGLAFLAVKWYTDGMKKVDFNRQMKEQIAARRGEKLLLHSCCGPCSSRCLEALKDSFSVTVYYYNPNITDPAEYAKRKGEQLRFLRETGWADFLDCAYAPEAFFAAVAGLEGEKEGGARCYRCYALRLEETARAAAENGFSLFCSTLSVSPHKNAVWLNELGAALGEKYGVQWLYNDFKKENGYLRSLQLSNEHGLYRQNYCGCIFSDWRKKEKTPPEE